MKTLKNSDWAKCVNTTVIEQDFELYTKKLNNLKKLLKAYGFNFNTEQVLEALEKFTPEQRNRVKISEEDYTMIKFYFTKNNYEKR